MQKYLIEVRDIKTDETALLQIAADSPDEAMAEVDLNQWEVLRVRKPWGGRRDGAGRVSKWGDGVKTERYRLPIPLGSNAEEVVSSIESLKTVLEIWEAKVTESKNRSGGKPSERYRYVEQMAQELRTSLKDLPESLVE
jgi:hypothetical protein